jgi:sensor histidine kinase YesM
MGYSQNPSYFTIGEEELANAEIYSILETKTEQVYITTDIGLFKYENNSFTYINPPKGQIKTSLFNLRENKKGTIFCSNLNGQVYLVKDKQMVLYAQLPKESISLNTFMEFDNQDHLILSSKDCYKVTSDSITLIKKSNDRGNHHSVLTKLCNNELIFQYRNSDSIFFIKNGAVSEAKKVKENIQLFCLEGDKIFVNKNTQEYEFFNNKALFNNIIPTLTDRYFQINNKGVWVLDNKQGIKVLDIYNDTIYEKEHIFQHTFISAIHQSPNCIYLGTFGQGIIVIPNYNVKVNVKDVSSQKIKNIAVDQKNNVFFSKLKIGVYHYKDSVSILDQSVNYSFEKVFCMPNNNVGISSNFHELYYEKKRKSDDCLTLRYVKDVCQLNGSALLFATSEGLVIKGEFQPNSLYNWENYPKCSSNYFFYKKLDDRCLSCCSDTLNNHIYVATTSSLFKIDLYKNISKQEILFQEKSLFCNDIIYHDGILWCATKANGIIGYKDHIPVLQYSTKNGLISNNISKIIIKNNLLFLTDGTYIQTIDLPTKTIKTFGIAEGIIGIINDFELSDDKLWILTDKTRILSTPIESLEESENNLRIFIDSITLYETKINQFKTQFFDYQQNHFAFYTSIKNIKYNRRALTKYRIKGFEEKWNTLYTQYQKIEYKSLPPGKYTFEVFAQYGDKKSALSTYSFTISPPYWQKWWFYITLILFIFITSFFIFRIRIKNIRKKNNELIEKQTLKTNLLDSELKALRSQMNPHFIFNALNSIQDLILREETDASYDYIVLFSELVRNTLNYSNKDFIPITSELKFIDIYLQLEKLRFEDSFSYTITYNGEKSILVPSLIVQPFIENALKHGLLHKSGDKKLSIHFELTHQLVCTIIDNGIGRKAAQKIQERQGNKHESFALEAIKKRLNILSRSYGKEIGFEVFDLENPTGTKIKLFIPFKNKY